MYYTKLQDRDTFRSFLPLSLSLSLSPIRLAALCSIVHSEKFTKRFEPPRNKNKNKRVTSPAHARASRRRRDAYAGLLEPGDPGGDATVRLPQILPAMILPNL